MRYAFAKNRFLRLSFCKRNDCAVGFFSLVLGAGKEYGWIFGIQHMGINVNAGTTERMFVNVCSSWENLFL